jgi:hypothetical protein
MMAAIDPLPHVRRFWPGNDQRPDAGRPKQASLVVHVELIGSSVEGIVTETLTAAGRDDRVGDDPHLIYQPPVPA